jgi:hypothetical protein
MKSGVFMLVFLTAVATALHADSRHILRASFPDGTGLEIFTETNGSSQIDSEGEMGIGPGAGPQCVDPSRADCPDAVNRVVVDRANNVLFVYNVEASQGKSPHTVMIRIKPISPATEAGMLKYYVAAPGHPRFTGAHLPTVAGVREFPAVKIGEAVTLDILSNPSTGEKIFDVLRPIRLATPARGMSVTPAPAGQTISLNDIALRVNGRAVSAPASFIIGSAVRIDIPSHGTYVVTPYDPHEASSGHQFSAVAHADGKTLSWVMGSDRVEITSSTNVLPRSENGTLWVYHDPHYRPDVVGLQAADTVEWLLPKR